MSKLSLLTARELTSTLKAFGFEFIRQRGSHMFFRHADGRTTVVPNHPGEQIDRGLLNKIIRQDLQVGREDFTEKLRRKGSGR